MSNHIRIVTLDREHMRDVIHVLQSISSYSPPEEQYDEIWIKFSGQDHVQALVAIVGERVVGYGSVSFETRIRGGKVAHVEDIACLREFRGMGVGKAIVDALSKLAFEQSCFKLSLQCEKDNVLFYEKCSFKVSGVSMQQFFKAKA